MHWSADRDETQDFEPSGHEPRACYRQSLEAAERQQAKSNERRTTMRLCRLLQNEGIPEKGTPLLKEVYDWFTEGFDTPDLIEAKSLLNELTG